MANPNFQLLVDAAKLLKPILGELVFVGGCTTALLITDKAAADVRPTFDVDAIAEITSYVGEHGPLGQGRCVRTGDLLEDAQKKIERFRARQRSL